MSVVAYEQPGVQGHAAAAAATVAGLAAAAGLSPDHMVEIALGKVSCRHHQLDEASSRLSRCMSAAGQRKVGGRGLTCCRRLLLSAKAGGWCGKWRPSVRRHGWIQALCSGCCCWLGGVRWQAAEALSAPLHNCTCKKQNGEQLEDFHVQETAGVCSAGICMHDLAASVVAQGMDELIFVTRIRKESIGPDDSVHRITFDHKPNFLRGIPLNHPKRSSNYPIPNVIKHTHILDCWVVRASLSQNKIPQQHEQRETD